MKVPHLTGLIDDVLRSDGFKPPYSSQQLCSMFTDEQNRILAQYFSVDIQFLFNQEFDPIIQWPPSLQVLKDYKVHQLKIFMDALLGMVNVMEPNLLYDDRSEIIERFLNKPRFDVKVIVKVNGTYALVDYLLRCATPPKIPPYQQSDLERGFKHIGFDHVYFNYNLHDLDEHPLLLPRQDFERMIGMKRGQDVIFTQGHVWFDRSMFFNLPPGYLHVKGYQNVPLPVIL